MGLWVLEGRKAVARTQSRFRRELERGNINGPAEQQDIQKSWQALQDWEGNDETTLLTQLHQGNAVEAALTRGHGSPSEH